MKSCYVNLEKQIKRVQTVTDNLEKKETSIYTNILTMMGIFVSIFSMIVINFSAINQANFNRDFILTININSFYIFSFNQLN